MCGIHGVMALGGSAPVSAADLRRMGEVAAHRGPDDFGDLIEGPLGFGMQRLSIIDVEGGHQPIYNEDRSVVVVCNGEIYNFQTLRSDLTARGHTFSTNSDVEVIVHLYEEYGDACIEHLRGMFGFALWDIKRQRLLLGRDRTGIKPLYFCVKDNRLAFASEAKSILALPWVSRALNHEALPHYLHLGYVPAPWSMFEGIEKLPPATLMIVEDGRIRQHTYWTMPPPATDSGDLDTWSDQLRETLADCVERQMVSDVPLGAFLSGGIDSSAVVAMMSRFSADPVRTFAIGFGGSSGGSFYNELPYAQRVAELFKTDHREIVVEPSVVELMPRLLWHMDEPIADTAFITTYLVSEFARREVTVILSGVGGDELFGGYRRYLGGYYARALSRVPRIVRQSVVKPVLGRMPVDRHSRVANLTRYARALVQAADWPLAQQYQSFVEAASMTDVVSLMARAPDGFEPHIEAAFAKLGGGDPLEQMTRVDLTTQLPDDLLSLTDRMSMATSLECRVPLLDEAIIDLAMKMPSKHKISGRDLKHVLKHALRDVLPQDILYRQKRGFGAPMGAWFKNELRPLVDQLLSSSRIESRGWLNPATVQTLREEHDANRADHTDKLVALTNLEMWAQIYLDGREVDTVRDELLALVAA
ncbi:MAG: asparagine synthase (glutamine-hydrolyzing) [Gammaproteobacteria bacterium]